MPKLKITVDNFEITSIVMDIDHLEDGTLNHIDIRGHELIRQEFMDEEITEETEPGSLADVL